ncbi:MAG: hypothetical protein ACYCOU_02760 [Sulfobacillus sp.]
MISSLSDLKKFISGKMPEQGKQSDPDRNSAPPNFGGSRECAEDHVPTDSSDWSSELSSEPTGGSDISSGSAVAPVPTGERIYRVRKNEMPKRMVYIVFTVSDVSPYVRYGASIYRHDHQKPMRQRLSCHWDTALWNWQNFPIEIDSLDELLSSSMYESRALQQIRDSRIQSKSGTENNLRSALAKLLCRDKRILRRWLYIYGVRRYPTIVDVGAKEFQIDLPSYSDPVEIVRELLQRHGIEPRISKQAGAPRMHLKVFVPNKHPQKASLEQELLERSMNYQRSLEPCSQSQAQAQVRVQV